MNIKTADNGDFVFIFEAREVELGVKILESIIPATEEDEAKIQNAIDQLLAGNNLHQYRTLN